MLSEKNILNIIRYGPVIPLLILSFFITSFSIKDKSEDLQNEIENMKVNYLNENKQLVKKEIDKVVYLINSEIQKSEYNLKRYIKQRVYEAHNVATQIYESAIKDRGDSPLVKKQVFETIKYTLSAMSYKSSKGYFFIDDINGNKLLQPFNKTLEGENFLHYKDPTGYRFIEKRIEVIKKKSEAFDRYFWYKPNNKKDLFEKISFYRYFEPYNVSIGMGEYIVDFESELKKKVLEWIKKIKDRENSYIFVYDDKGVCLSHIKEEYIGKNRINLKDSNGRYFLRDILALSKKDKEGFINYYASFKSDFKSSDKISYVKLLEKWNWTLGTGFYLDKLKKEIAKKEQALIEHKKILINNILLISGLLTFFLILISFYISNMIAKRFMNYKKDIEKEMEKTIEKEKLLIQQSKMAMMGEMIGNIAHQWKQPLSVIAMSNTLLRLSEMDENFTTKEKRKSALEDIDTSVLHLSHTIDDFKNFFNPNKEKVLFSIEETFEKTFKLISSQFNDSKIQIIKKIDDVKIEGFQNQLLHVLINILKNARDEFLKDKREIPSKKLLFIDVHKRDNSVIIKIKDTNGGIDTDIIDNIFDPYFTTKENSGGTGIGLYMSKQIIEDHMDGKLEVSNVEFTCEDNLYKGAEFTIILPL